MDLMAGQRGTIVKEPTTIFAPRIEWDDGSTCHVDKVEARTAVGADGAATASEQGGLE